MSDFKDLGWLNIPVIIAGLAFVVWAHLNVKEEGKKIEEEIMSNQDTISKKELKEVSDSLIHLMDKRTVLEDVPIKDVTRLLSLLDSMDIEVDSIIGKRFDNREDFVNNFKSKERDFGIVISGLYGSYVAYLIHFNWKVHEREKVEDMVRLRNQVADAFTSINKALANILLDREPNNEEHLKQLKEIDSKTEVIRNDLKK